MISKNNKKFLDLYAAVNKIAKKEEKAWKTTEEKAEETETGINI